QVSTSIFNRHLVGFVRFFLNPVNGLVGTGELADAAELPSVEMSEPAVGAALRPVKFRHDDPPKVRVFSLFENPVRADLCTEIAALAPGLVNGEFHGICPIYVASEVKKIYVLRAFPSLSRPYCTLCMFPHGLEEIVAVCIDPDHERQPVKLDYPDRFCHAKVREVDAFQRHVRCSKRRTAPGKGKVDAPSPELLPHGGIHPAFPDQPPDPPVEQEAGEGIHPGRGGRPCGYDPVVFYYRAAMVDHGPLRVKWYPLFLHTEMSLVACSKDKTRELNPVPGMECKDFIAKGCFEPDSFFAHQSTSTVACRFVQHCTFTATGREAVWHAAVFTLTARAVVFPPSPIGPIPRRFTASQSFCSNASIRSIGWSRASLASAGAESNVPPIPTPSTTGGQGRPSAISIVPTTTSSIFPTCDGRSITTRDTFSAPAPLGSTVTANRSPGRTWIAGIPTPVLSPELCRVRGSTTLGRNGISSVARRMPSEMASKRTWENGTPGGRVR